MKTNEQVEAIACGDVRPVLEHRLIVGHDGTTDGLIGLGLLYVGDQLARLAEALELVATPSTNGAGEVVGRTFEVAAALRAEGHA